MKSLLLFLIIVAWCACSPVAMAEPPKVTNAIPRNGAVDVDPTLTQLRVVFDQPMSSGGWSVVGGGPLFPKFIGKARWENDRTFVWTWRLESEHDYWISLNNDSFANFRGTNGEPAVPYPISFRTGKPAAQASGSAGEASLVANRQAVVLLQQAINEDYSYRDLRGVDWDRCFKEFVPKLQAATSPRQFAGLAAQLLSPARDIHIWLNVTDQTVPTFQRRAPWNVATAYLPRQIPGWRRQSSAVCTGRFEDGIRYIFISSLPAAAGDEFEPAFLAMAEAAEAGKPLIIDFRANGGGSEKTAGQFAGCFVDRPVVYAKHLTRRDGRFSEPQSRELQPNKARPRFRGPVAVLMGQGTVSSAESFVMMMKQVPGCTLVGDRTAGCSGNPRPVDLGNGVVAFLPSWRDLRLDGTCLEGEGFSPDLSVKTTPEDFQKNDPVIEAALRVLRRAP